ncbi:DUF3139 domain-containing protein [Staphylococcus caprae]|uniref:DUF3139 domain-containing protein n=1 Tax=Staphylococcus TaxID=1279 RepID=UPI0008A8B601|nr:DUF3139 domain-containing protein [Staphylococcus sp. HMSC62A08]OHS41532.1 hypothetical protein HMPREF3264_01635 [Staphylococcus sp. HMSC62A08]
MQKKYIIITIIIIIFLGPALIFNIGKHIYFKYQSHEEAKTKAKVHRVLKKKGWEDKIKKEEAAFTLNTKENNVEVTFKDEPYNTYQYDVNDDGKVTGDAELKMKYKERFDNDKKYREYRERHRFEEKYDLK